MTKKELLELMKDMSDNYELCVHRPYEGTDPAGLYEIKSIKEHEVIKTIEFIVSED